MLIVTHARNIHHNPIDWDVLGSSLARIRLGYIVQEFDRFALISATRLAADPTTDFGEPCPVSPCSFPLHAIVMQVIEALSLSPAFQVPSCALHLLLFGVCF
jgi:hypothetical protein